MTEFCLPLHQPPMRRQHLSTLHSLAQMGLLPPIAPPASDAETLSDTLSAHTPLASPRGGPLTAEAPAFPPAPPGDAPPTAPRQTTPGYWAAGRVQKLLVARSLVACGCEHGHSTRYAASAGADWFAHSPARRRYLSIGLLPCLQSVLCCVRHTRAIPRHPTPIY